MNDDYQKNVFGEKLELCSNLPLTGWFRDGCCNTNDMDRGGHTVCAKVNNKFLLWLKKEGNDLITPNKEFEFAGLKDGDSWCICGSWYVKAVGEGYGCPIYLRKTNIRILELIPINELKKFAIDLS